MQVVTWTESRLQHMVARIVDDQRPVFWIGGLLGGGVGLLAIGLALAGQSGVLREVALRTKAVFLLLLAGAGLILVARLVDGLRANVAARTITVTNEHIAIGGATTLQWSELDSVSMAKVLRWNLMAIRRRPGRRIVIVPADRLREVAALLPQQAMVRGN